MTDQIIKGNVRIELVLDDIEIYDDGLNDFTDQLYAHALAVLGIDDEHIDRSSVQVQNAQELCND